MTKRISHDEAVELLNAIASSTKLSVDEITFFGLGGFERKKAVVDAFLEISYGSGINIRPMYEESGVKFTVGRVAGRGCIDEVLRLMLDNGITLTLENIVSIDGEDGSCKIVPEYIQMGATLKEYAQKEARVSGRTPMDHIELRGGQGFLSM